jgi:hypothetical protein
LIKIASEYTAPTCADDVSLITDSEKNLQILIDTVVNYSKQENYKLQPAKSAVMSFNTNMENPGYNHTINNESIQKPDTIVHLGITHHRNYRKTTSTQIQENMEKSRCTLYSFLGAGLHGKNGLNPRRGGYGFLFRSEFFFRTAQAFEYFL